ncbi:MAG: hypothetical protein HY742_08595 [Deltaproteobacteria bacterium]|nr:hypothetical protein [Deltaproteobacteria bacterium]
MIRFLIYGILFYLLYKAAKNFLRPRKGRSGGSRNEDSPVRGEDLVEDPCCHTYIPVSNAYKSFFDGRTVYFCSQKCLDAYRSQRGC